MTPYSKDILKRKASAVISAARIGGASEAERLAAIAVKTGVKPYGEFCVSVVLGSNEYRIMDAAHHRLTLAEVEKKYSGESREA